MNKELIENIKGRIALDEQHRGNPEQASWREEDGVLLSRNEARECLAALEGREQACEAVIDMAKKRSYDEELKRVGCAFSLSSRNKATEFSEQNWQEHLTTQARAFLVREGKITE